MDKYNIIDMFDQLDVTLLEGLNLEKDFKRQRKNIRSTIEHGQIKMVGIVVGICAVITGVLALLMQMKRKNFQKTMI